MNLDWISDGISWLGSAAGREFLVATLVPFFAIIVAGIVAALIGRGAIRRLTSQQERQARVTAISALLAVLRRVTVWTSLSVQEKDHVDYQITESLVRVRMLSVKGADLAAEWVQHHVRGIKRHSATMVASAEAELADVEDTLIEWNRHPSRAKKLFSDDIAAMRLDSTDADTLLAARQRQWVNDRTRPGTEADAANTRVNTDDLTEILVDGANSSAGTPSAR